ncbi:hypothetical protein Tsp_03099 [Trichinella spiralis]|uniref:hypothetical protein n=1 Tax=Trichinella spiralis TaxID=6334 RepID=UPI0001EFB9D9|nr:hypothetical protein Tsp_03099 [Trichinella spiralis]
MLIQSNCTFLEALSSNIKWKEYITDPAAVCVNSLSRTGNNIQCLRLRRFRITKPWQHASAQLEFLSSISSVIERYSYHMMTSASIFMSLKNECYKCKVSTTVLTRLIEISKQYCIVTMFSIICMDVITKTGYITNNVRPIAVHDNDFCFVPNMFVWHAIA